MMTTPTKAAMDAAKTIADRSPWKPQSDNYARILQAAASGYMIAASQTAELLEALEEALRQLSSLTRFVMR